MNTEHSPATHQPRRKKLVQPGLQLQVSLWTLCLVTATLVIQYLFTLRLFAKFALDLPGNPQSHFNEFMRQAFQLLAVSLGVVLPLTFFVGVLATFRLVGPLKRMHSFLTAIHRGERPPDFQLRKGDHLQDYCILLNEVTRPLRTTAAARDSKEERAA
jgi:hypothetical protein